jgi:hypothetical protein
MGSNNVMWFATLGRGKLTLGYACTALGVLGNDFFEYSKLGNYQ